MEACRCIALCSTRLTTSACTWQFPPVASTAPTMRGAHGQRKTAASALCSCPISIPNSGSAYTRSHCILIVQDAFSCKIIGDSIALTTALKPGRTLLMACRRISVLPLSYTPKIPTGCMSFQSSPMSFGARAKADCGFIELATLGPRGSPSCVACHKNALTKLSCVMQCPQIHSIRPEFT